MPNMVDPAMQQPSAQAPQPGGFMEQSAWTYAGQSEQDKKLAGDWLKRIEAAQNRPAIKEAVAKFERNRKLLRGINPDTNKKMRSNLYFAELARMRPQVYAKDPEFAVVPNPGVSPNRKEAAENFSKTAVIVLDELLVKKAFLKKRAKRLLTACFTTCVGWWKMQWQETPKVDTLIQNRIKDTQDNLERIQAQREKLDDPYGVADQDAEIARLKEMLEGLQSLAEVSVVRGLVLDFVLSEDILILDESVRELGDYERASAMDHRVWMTRAKFRETFGAEPSEKVKVYKETTSGITSGAGDKSSSDSRDADLFAVHEIWDQDSNRIFHVVEGGEGFCRQPFTPDWTGERWYPFFALAWNEVDGSFMPLSDIELIEPLVSEYNDSRDDFVKDRKDTRPFTVVRKGGALTPDDVSRIRNRDGNDIIAVEGVGQKPISNDIQAVTLGSIQTANYDTSPARADMEQILGGGDASRGSVLKAKTATEAEILSQGLRSRSAERTDIMEDLLSEVGQYALQVCLRKLSPEEVKRIAGEDSSWPTLSWQQALEQVMVTVRGGSTGKPDRLQDQDRWTKLMPVIKDTMQQVAELRAKGQNDMAQALITLTRETLRRFDERVDLDQFLPPEHDQEQLNPAALMNQLQAMKDQLRQAMEELDKLKEQQEKGYINAAAQIATSANPLQSAQAFGIALQSLESMENDDKTGDVEVEDQGTDMPPMSGMQPQPMQ